MDFWEETQVEASDDFRACEEAEEMFRRGEIRIPEKYKSRSYGSIVDELNEVFGEREYNTLPEKVELVIIFHEEWPEAVKYQFHSKSNVGERNAMGILATVRYNVNASNMIMGDKYPLALSRGAMVGLANYIKNNGGNYDLNDRTFKVLNKNRKTYVWKEIKRTSHTGK
ncbi:hypothetical protein JW968_05270 [Candidatus Woesearchaeota archaeon]|nr:hypothetical protein [Candidatus Woesearchaeota archaeon]